MLVKSNELNFDILNSYINAWSILFINTTYHILHCQQPRFTFPPQDYYKMISLSFPSFTLIPGLSCFTATMGAWSLKGS